MKRVDEFNRLHQEFAAVLGGSRSAVRFSEHNSGAAMLVEPTAILGGLTMVFLDRFAAAIKANEAVLIRHVLDEARAAAVAEATEVRDAANAALTRFCGPQPTGSAHDLSEQKGEV